jgi:hypothetical protein
MKKDYWRKVKRHTFLLVGLRPEINRARRDRTTHTAAHKVDERHAEGGRVQ